MVEEQIRVMNKAYADSRFSFNTKNITFTVNDAWATALDGPIELEYKKALRQGTYQDLNLFFLSDLGGGLLGFCYLPVGREELDDELRILDSRTNLAGSMPGGVSVLEQWVREAAMLIGNRRLCPTILEPLRFMRPVIGLAFFTRLKVKVVLEKETMLQILPEKSPLTLDVRGTIVLIPARRALVSSTRSRCVKAHSTRILSQLP